MLCSLFALLTKLLFLPTRDWPSNLPDQRAPTSTPTPTPPRPTPHYHRQLPPLSHTNPIASLTAALRGEDTSSLQYDRLGSHARPATTAPSPRLPTSPRHHQHSPREAGAGRARPIDAPQSGPSNRPATPPTVELSTSTSPPTMPRPAAGSSSRKRSRATSAIALDDSPEAKRPRQGSASQHIDLSFEDDDDDDRHGGEEDDNEAPTAEQEMLEKERQELVKRQKEESGRAVRINDLTCMICLERFTNMSVTHCGKWTLTGIFSCAYPNTIHFPGHIFCHECLTQALNASERSSDNHVGSCPACRKPVKRGASARNQIIPLALMKKPKSVQQPTKGCRGPRKRSRSSTDVDVV